MVWVVPDLCTTVMDVCLIHSFGKAFCKRLVVFDNIFSELRGSLLVLVWVSLDTGFMAFG